MQRIGFSPGQPVLTPLAPGWHTAGVNKQMARVALESRLRALYVYRVRVNVPKRYTSKDLAGQLLRARVIDKETQRDVKKALEVGNRAAHNQPIDCIAVMTLIESAQWFIACHSVRDIEEALGKFCDDVDDAEGGAL